MKLTDDYYSTTPFFYISFIYTNILTSWLAAYQIAAEPWIYLEQDTLKMEVGNYCKDIINPLMPRVVDFINTMSLTYMYYY